MPDDGLIGFRFFSNDNGLSVVDDHAQQQAAQHLANDIAYYNAIEHLVRATDAVQTAALRHDRQHNDPIPDDGPSDGGLGIDLAAPDDFLLG